LFNTYRVTKSNSGNTTWVGTVRPATHQHTTAGITPNPTPKPMGIQ
jgi:hypothetical protein